MAKLMLLALLIGCSAKTQSTSSSSGSGSGASATASGSAASPPAPPPTPPGAYTGPLERGPCQSAHGCKLRDVCGCRCEAVVLAAPSKLDCDKSCPGTPCKGMSLICDLATQTCGAIPPPP